MVGLGVTGFTQPLSGFPQLTAGNHLRWSFDPRVGFPRHGYYLFRRLHEDQKESGHRLSRGFGAYSSGETPTDTPFETTGGTVIAEEPATVTLVGNSTSGEVTGVQIGTDSVRFRLPGPTFSVTVIADGELEVVAGADGSGSRGVPVGRDSITGGGEKTLSFDVIDWIELRGAGVLVDCQFHLVEDSLTDGWQPVPNAPQPISLPLSHPDYPATGGVDPDVAGDRAEATDRIHYGEPTTVLTPPESPIQSGQATVTAGSTTVTSSDGTGFPASLVGSVFRPAVADGAYVITAVLDEQTLALGRPYEGAGGTTDYEIESDRFGELSDALSTLVTGGIEAGGMAPRVQPAPVEDGGWTTVSTSDPLTINGWSTNWSSELEGATFVAAAEHAGSVAVTNGDRQVTRNSGWGGDPSWDEHLEGHTLVLDGQRTRYTIVDVDGETLSLDQPYLGPPRDTSGYTVFEPTGYEIESVESPTELRLATPYRGSVTTPIYEIRAPLSDPDGGPTVAQQRPLESVLLASLSPAMAQVLGLYWIDEAIDSGTSYDYLIVADHDGTVQKMTGGGARIPPDLFESADGYITFDVRATDSTLEPPTGVTAYELPKRPPGNGTGPRNVAGLGWEYGVTASGTSLPSQPVLYHLWVAELGETEPDGPAPPRQFTPLTQLPAGTGGERAPVLAGQPQRSQPDEWPNAPIHAIDTDLEDGWYGYRVSGVDVFGRSSERSQPARWIDYEGETPTLSHPSAIELRDRTPPPPPRGVSARYEPPPAGEKPNGTATIRWVWPASFRQQAPGIDRFRLSYHPGRFTDQVGTITAVESQSAMSYTVTTDITPLEVEGELPPPNAYLGATLRVDGVPFRVVESDTQAGTLILTVVDERAPTLSTLATADGPISVAEVTASPFVSSSEEIQTGGSQATDGGAPAEFELTSGAACTVSLPPAYTEGSITVNRGSQTVIGHDTAWTELFEGQSITMPDGDSYSIAAVVSEIELELEEPYRIPDLGVGARVESAYAIDHPMRPDVDDPATWDEPTDPPTWVETWATVDREEFTMVAASDSDPTPPTSGGPDPADKQTDLFYEATIPIPGTGDPEIDPFVPTAEEPVVYGNLGVTAIDAEDVESRVGGPTQIARAKATPPPTPGVPSFETDVDWATEPDYDGNAQYTVRWEHPDERCRTHIFRTMDKSLYANDWRKRRAGEHTPLTDDDEDASLFPPAIRDDRVEREAVVARLESLHDDVTDEDDESVALESYFELPETEKQVLGALPCNRDAYRQLTTEPLAPGDEVAANRKGPDFDPETDTLPSGDRWCAYVDEFPGRSARQYFYRTGTVDDAGNRSEEWTYPTPPVQAVNVTPPKAPTAQSILGGDREITLQWAANPERDLAAYRVYRTTDEAAARDIRLMTEVHTESAGTAPSLTWVDTEPPILTDTYYRLVAVDEAGNVSNPSSRLVGRAVDTAPPSPPTPTATVVSGDDQTVELTWSSAYETILQRRKGGEEWWESLTDWLEPGDRTETDDVNAASTYEYRLRARKPETGAVDTGDATTVSTGDT